MGLQGRRVALIDQDGVLVDKACFEPEWARLAGEVFTPLLGGDPEGWAGAQRAAWLAAIRIHWDLSAPTTEVTTELAPGDGWASVFGEWVRGGCERQGVEAPASVEERAEIGREAMRRFFARADALVDDAGPAIERLAARFELHMASGNPRVIIEAVLERLGARRHIGQPFGSDLLGEYKERMDAFHPAICEALGVRAEEAIVIDDNPRVLDAARRHGALTVCIGSAGDHDLVAPTFRAAVDRLLEQAG